MIIRSVLFLILFPVYAVADSPFTGPRKREKTEFNNPNSREAQYRAVEDLLGIRHFGFLLHVRPEAPTYAVRLEVPSGDGEMKVLKEILMTAGASPVGLGISVLTTGNLVKLKLYTSSEESLHEIALVGKNAHVERGPSDDGVLLRCVDGDKESFVVTWTELTEEEAPE